VSVLDKITVSDALSAVEMEDIRSLFLEYADSLEISLCFQNFEAELVSLPGKYAPPSGRLLLARDGNQRVGCAGLRPLEAGICEMKRLYVRPQWRGRGIGQQLARLLIDAARHAGYSRMRLDTLNTMKSAIALYTLLGFRRIEAYYDNPSDRAVFMELVLQNPDR
jgi:ribosomal protein S18 acetylase RimI-like enzyme